MRKMGLLLIAAVAFSYLHCGGTALRPPVRDYVEPRHQAKIAEAGQQTTLGTLEQRLVIYDARLWLKALQPDSVHHQLVRLTKSFQGYVLKSEDDETSIRVPAADLTRAMDIIEKLGKVTKRSIAGQDVTDEYRDLETRLDSAEKGRQRYLELLSKAENVASALQVERELERLSNEIELLKGRLQRMDHLVQYATVTVYTESEVRLGPIGLLSYGIYKAISWLFVRS